VNDEADLLAGTVQLDSGVVVTMTGEIDIFTAPYFRTLVVEAISIGTGTVTVNLASVTFMDARGLTVLVGAVEQLNNSGRQLIVQAPPAPIRRLFEITGLTEVLGVDVEVLPPTSALVQALALAADEPRTRGLLDAALKSVVTIAQAVVGGADGASITMPRQGRMNTVAASNEMVLDMDTDQYDSGQGPCLDAASLGERFHIDSLNTETRWPEFVPRARARGIRSIMSTPLMDSAGPLGALNIYSRTVDAFAQHEQHWADTFAAQAALVLTQARTRPSTPELDEQLQRALQSREVIALAQGITIGRVGGTPPQAYAVLRDVSVRTGLPLLEVCEQVVATEVGRTPTHLLVPGGNREPPPS
jgi:anti-anti-sigma factor